MNNNEDKIRKALTSEQLPEQLSPDNIKKMLDEKAPAKKRNKITHKAARVTATAVACAVICGLSVYYTEQRDFNYNNKEISEISMEEISQESSAENAEETQTMPSYMTGASDYKEIYRIIEQCAKDEIRQEYDGDFFYTQEAGIGGAEITDVAGGFKEPQEESMAEDVETNSPSDGMGEENSGHYETYNQEEGVIEGDIARTDGKYIYFIPEYYSDEHTYLNIAEADNGSFITGNRTNVSADITEELCKAMDIDESETRVASISETDLFLYNDMVIVTGSASISGFKPEHSESGFCDCVIMPQYSFAAFYTEGTDPQFIGCYIQNGYGSDVRISPEGFLYIISSYNTAPFSTIDGEEDYEAYIPCRVTNGCAELIEPEDILIPAEYQSDTQFGYTVISSLDLNTAGQFTKADSKALAGFTGTVYCSPDNLYTAYGYRDTEITRISLASGMITPAASGKIEGYIHDQFSMSEYNGYFRVAATVDIWENEYYSSSTDNRVYVLDMDMNIVGQIGGLGVGETIKSANFSGDIGYVVTYRQTDPLYSIDLSNPGNPVLMDEHKILGYSTYMQQWSDGLLLGFGANADENGVEDGVKLVMFDNSDPDNLSEKGIVIMDSSYFESANDISWLYSDALYERKALLIAPEKNLIGVPVYCETYSDKYYDCKSSYIFFSYENGEFICKGSMETGTIDSSRAIYIGDFVYVLSECRFVSADVETITETDSIDF